MASRIVGDKTQDEDLSCFSVLLYIVINTVKNKTNTGDPHGELSPPTVVTMTTKETTAVSIYNKL